MPRAQRQPDPDALLPLRPVMFAALLALSQEPRHGYAIMQYVNQHGGGSKILGPGTLYRTLKEMRDLSLVEQTSYDTDDSAADERRHYYQLTPFGRKVMTAEATRLATLLRGAKLGRLLPRSGSER